MRWARLARVTLSIDDEIAAQLDAFAEENSLNRSQAAEQILRKFFLAAEQQTEGQDAQVALEEIRSYVSLLHSALVVAQMDVPDPPWKVPPAPSFLGRGRTLRSSASS
jgi:metal-responsive CopG/Arc/MetJ family transcriptional regulator